MTLPVGALADYNFKAGTYEDTGGVRALGDILDALQGVEPTVTPGVGLAAPGRCTLIGSALALCQADMAMYIEFKNSLSNNSGIIARHFDGTGGPGAAESVDIYVEVDNNPVGDTLITDNEHLEALPLTLVAPLAGNHKMAFTIAAAAAQWAVNGVLANDEEEPPSEFILVPVLINPFDYASFRTNNSFIERVVIYPALDGAQLKTLTISGPQPASSYGGGDRYDGDYELRVRAFWNRWDEERDNLDAVRRAQEKAKLRAEKAQRLMMAAKTSAEAEQALAELVAAEKELEEATKFLKSIEARLNSIELSRDA